MDASDSTESNNKACNCKSRNRNILILLLLLAVLACVASRKYNHTQALLYASLQAKVLAADGADRSKLKFKTNTEKHSIELDQIQGGGPGKDGIPALNHPEFVSADKASCKADQVGILVTAQDQAKFYPYNILVWHELVNDSIGDLDFLVSFCPLCGSGIVNNRKVEGQTLEFGVSGMLYESNMLMFDRDSESLWSQSRYEAVVGDRLGQRLEVLPMQLLRFDKVREKFPDVLVLSRNTGYLRDYDRWPYVGYEQRERLSFPVSSQNNQFTTKQMMYVLPINEKSLAIPLIYLQEGQNQQRVVGQDVVLNKSADEIQGTVNGQDIAGYYEMWFSWFVQHAEDGVVWAEPSTRMETKN